jgi:hypothetical protein
MPSNQLTIAGHQGEERHFANAHFPWRAHETRFARRSLRTGGTGWPHGALERRTRRQQKYRQNCNETMYGSHEDPFSYPVCK